MPIALACATLTLIFATGCSSGTGGSSDDYYEEAATNVTEAEKSPQNAPTNGNQSASTEKPNTESPNTEAPSTPSTSVTSFSVIFDPIGGTQVSSQKVESGKTAKKPSNPTRTGFIFREPLKTSVFRGNFENAML